MHARKIKKADVRFRALLWTALIGLIVGCIDLSELDDPLRTARNRLHWHKASGEIVLVKIDDASLQKVGRWPWPRARQAQLVDRLSEAGAKRIFIDILFDAPSNPRDDALLADSIRRSGRVVLASMARSGPHGGETQDAMPLPQFARHAQIGSITIKYNFQNAVWNVPYSAQMNGRAVPSFASLLSGVPGAPNTFFKPDYSLNPASIPTLSAADVLAGRFDRGSIAGKSVLVGTTSDAAGDQFFLPGTGKSGGVYVHAIGAETLKHGKPVSGGWLPMLLLAILAAALAERRSNAVYQALIIGGAFGGLLFGPALLEAKLIYLDIMPALVVVMIYAGVLIRRHLRQRGMVNAVSGLPNLNALQANREARDQALIAARVLNFAEVVSALPPESERLLIDQITARLAVGSKERTFYQGDGGIFAWFEESRKPFGHHIDALHALFRNPLRVEDMSIDLSISFGVEIGSGRSLANRLASALVAADDAAHQGLKWKFHDPETAADAAWRLSMLSQLDTAIDNGEVWIAFQPQLDLQSRRIVGAEALARWTHPEKGPVAASEFVAAAEQNDRIGKLTNFVMEKAVAAAAAINKRDHEFTVAVNLSARLLTDKQLVMRVEALLARHNLAPKCLTLELTETSELVDSGQSLEMLSRLCDLGVGISIDDYGTGLSTLDYLKKIPANEIKIDQSFVKGLADNRSDRLMVHSTIDLAHSLGRRVVAEGVEHRDILIALSEMGCDLAQGFNIGRPMSFDNLVKRLSGERRRSAA